MGVVTVTSTVPVPAGEMAVNDSGRVGRDHPGVARTEVDGGGVLQVAAGYGHAGTTGDRSCGRAQPVTVGGGVTSSRS